MKSSPRDVFLYLLLMITLYVSVGSFTALLFQYINVLFPDSLEYGQGALDIIRRSTAALIILFPVYLFIALLLNRDVARDSGKAELSVRKWLLSLTLFLAALAIIGDLVTVLYHFLSGELSVRFILKAISVLGMAGAVFGYYLWDIREWKRGHLRQAGFVAWTSGAIVGACIIAGFFIAGSPWRQRSVRFDERRVNDLQMIQGEILRHWQMKGALSENLDALRDTISGFLPPSDPETGASYEYHTTGKLAFELCAVFAVPSRTQEMSRTRPIAPYPHDPYSQNWEHSEGRTCFTRTIDPELYPKEPKPPPLPNPLPEGEGM
ncbi:hypothetical protein A3H22_03765 [Candidatus Peribacteria bacterium RIFCSPLOWO2_12_FULL_55_15]|nr:MAG: hypothetical protein A2789_03550 [Candidatus Peribacteria bacterium RIFCSPHIGHO2_01_FULL_54_22]OGJ62684.1 MAG: hypothetical protein A3D12_04285 [Candidatus Peribacteria bacterium RIFCSPHIGHO2_02_FULL_55_24]OGJ68058.1 MAG: hypothetical protein A2947_01025 [Candidatus Peribacteria bacterium RIFCSPLOWO2_01_FULL_54_110]OGJ69033.1 MAG: hypothetical protein A3H90_03965 [Candidatus Peribacteria bacterium RIFCSPLOWO2_02_FULL_55_36]OGJ71827.1 MAG: hypothetical protein A3H22_03765 [Candidatus Per